MFCICASTFCRLLAQSSNVCECSDSFASGIRVICNYRDDVYSVSNYLSAQNDIQVLRVKDYIKNPKQNGYRSLHVIYAVPVFLSSGPQSSNVCECSDSFASGKSVL